jgi:2,3-bisphosphoglycerate-independent phosphoglycerate mutase
VQIPSDKIIFNEKPEMKAREITDAAKEAIKSGKYDMIRVNFANPDMVGHTGDLKATIFVRLRFRCILCCVERHAPDSLIL